MVRDTIPSGSGPGGGPAGALDEGFRERYSAVAQLGQGGMGEVRLCRDGRIGRDVAMKVVRAGSGGPPGLEERFLREARVQGQLEHPSIVPVYDLGRDPGGAPFFTMKRVNGRTLEAIIDALAAGEQDPYGRRKLLAAFTSVCLAVDYAHSRGFLHRDLKPANVMLGDFGEVYLLDWGLARAHGAADGDPATSATLSEHAGHTQHGSVLGSPGYMSPEQVRGELDRLDARSDVYALGSILFELLTLEQLHRADTLKGILDETLAGVDARAAARAPARDVPPELEAVCVRATQLDKEARFPSARELCQAVERYLDGDRDLALRRELADGHARAAHQAAERALEHGDVEARRLALREVGRALALFPDHAGALREFARLLARPPAALPETALAEQLAFGLDAQRDAGRVGIWAYLSAFVFVPMGLWMGIRSPWTWVIPVLYGICALLAFQIARRPHPQNKMPFGIVIFTTLAVASISLLFGPLIVVPSVAVVSTLSFLMSPDRTRRPLIIVCGVLALLVPLGLELAGVLPPAYSFDGERMIVFANGLHFPPVPTRLLLLSMNVMVVVASALLLSRMRDQLTTKEQQLHIQTWQLRQLVPDDASVPKIVPLPAPRGLRC